MKDPIEIFCSSNQLYAPLLLTTVKSLFNAATEPSRIHLHIVDRGIPDHLKDVMEAYVENARASLIWIDGTDEALQNLQNVPTSFFDLPNTGHYDRLLAPFLIDSPKALYLDTDLLVQGDITALWDTDFGGHPIVAVQDQIIPTVDADFGILDWENRQFEAGVAYFNSGVMLMDLEQWRKRKLPAKCCECALDFIKRFDEAPPLHDQYTLNAVCYLDWESTSMKWNTFAEKVHDNPEEAVIVHFAGSHKPFRHSSGMPAASKFFIRAAQKLMSGDFIETQETEACLGRLEALHKRFGSKKASLFSPNNNPISFSLSHDLAVKADEGDVVVVMPVLIRDPGSQRFENLCFLIEHYLSSIAQFVLVEQIGPSSSDCIRKFVESTNHPRLHHLQVEFEDDKIHKTSLINHGSKYAFNNLKSRYVWQIDADILVNAGAVLNQLNSLNSKAVPVVRPLLYFVRLNEGRSARTRSDAASELENYDPSTEPFNPYQIIDLFGPGTLIYSEEAFIATGGMDESYKGWGWEDMEYAERLSDFSRPHTLPLIGFHLFHEEDRLPRLENFDQYCQSCHTETSPEQTKKIFAHTVFHNFLTKFCIITMNTNATNSALLKGISELHGVTLRSTAVEPTTLPKNQELAPHLPDRLIYSLAQEKDRFAGFHWAANLPLIDPTTQHPVFSEHLIDFMVSSDFRIFLVTTSAPELHSTRFAEQRLTSLIGRSCSYYQHPINSILHTTTSEKIAASPDGTLIDCIRHLRLPGKTQHQPLGLVSI